MIGTENLKITHPSSPESRSTEDFFPSFNMVAPSVLPLPPRNLIRLLLCSFCAAARRDAANSDNTLFVHASYTAEIVNNSTSARKYCAQPAALMSKGHYFCRHKTPPVPQHRGQLVKEPRRVCARRRKESPIIFFGDMCGEENTSRPANVRAVCLRRTARALQSGRKSFVKKYYFLTDATPPVPQHRGCPLWCFSDRQRSALTGRDTSASALPPAHPSRAAV